MSDTLEVPSGAQSAGHFVPWEGGCLLIGRAAGIVPLHAHYATQISFGSHPGIRFRTGEEEWVDYAGAIVPSNRSHMMDATPVRMTAILFVEPETREGRALSERYPAHGIAAVTEDVLGEARDALFAAWREHGPRQAVADAARAVIQVLTGGLEPSVVSDERILRAIGYIQSHLDAPLTLETLAAEVFLSPGRFRHLFVEQTGMGLRPYILWRRFLRVWELAMAGETLSAAAHGAGFADSAHLTRTSRRMFGVPPSALQMVGPLSRG
jgi:AraC-like DNA-binding protein